MDVTSSLRPTENVISYAGLNLPDPFSEVFCQTFSGRIGLAKLALERG